MCHVFVTCSGIQLLEHEEVLFNYYENVNIQEAAITKGNMALETLEKEINDLQLAINEEKRQIDLKKNQVPLKRKLEGEITTLQIEVGEIWMYINMTYIRHSIALLIEHQLTIARAIVVTPNL